MQAIILCGGISTRLGDITKAIPKILLQVGDRTVLDWQLHFLREAGVDEVILASGHLHDILYEAVGENCGGMQIRYAKEEKKLGTGGAIQNAMQQISASPFFVLNGDVLLDFSVSKMLACLRPEMDGMLIGVLVEDISTYGEIISDDQDKITEFREKQPIQRPGYINAGVYLFNQSLANYFPDRDEFSIEREVFPYVRQLYAFKAEADWIDIGVPERLAYARQHFGR
ncbi:MAG: sugar phosphate nucleotidyltransferase [Candidatus Poribacteria bacterium]|nr:sugar phosphate nucleotidyltransferase [Candidatus Poribacteria bacterium]